MGCKSSPDATPGVKCTKCSKEIKGLLEPVNSKKGKKPLMSTGVKIDFPKESRI